MCRSGMLIACPVSNCLAWTLREGQAMATWRFYEGLRREWRWYHLDEGGQVAGASEGGFAELQACMDNAVEAGFTRSGTFHVHARTHNADAPQQ